MTDQANPSPIAVRVETAAKMLDTAPSTVAYWCRTGRLRASKVGRGWRIRVTDIEAMIQSQAVPA